MPPEAFAQQARAWLASAARHLRLGQAALAMRPPLPVEALGHAEQCCERCCKALIVAAGEKVPHTHLLGTLAGLLLQQRGQSPLGASEAEFVSSLQMLHRYGEENLELSELPEADAQRAVEIARDCYSASEAMLRT